MRRSRLPTAAHLLPQCMTRRFARTGGAWGLAGGIVGGVTAGFLSDKLRMRAFVAWMYLLLALPGLYFYRVLTRHYGDSSMR